MRREERLTKNSQFAAVFQYGKSWANGLMVIRAMPNGLSFSRFGFVISKRTHKKAVVRNRVKRRMREVVRLNSIEPGWDVVFIARKGSIEADYNKIEGAILDLLRRAKLLRRDS
ncbi:MAG: ribonuclease P protein component [Dehalococcoidia bacterium]